MPATLRKCYNYNDLPRMHAPAFCTWCACVPACRLQLGLGPVLPPGQVGEVCVGGRCLAAGYLDDPTATAQRFVTLNLAPAEVAHMLCGLAEAASTPPHGQGQEHGAAAPHAPGSVAASQPAVAAPVTGTPAVQARKFFRTGDLGMIIPNGEPAHPMLVSCHIQLCS